MEPVAPLYTAELFPPLHDTLIELLRGLPSDDWERPTVAGRWRVRDVAAHLLDGDLRKLSVVRDGHLAPPDEPVGDYADLVRFLDGLNAKWVDAARRLSPRVLVDLLAFTGPLVSELVASLPPHAPAIFSVAWAGEDASENWFDIGREYTERWHHQMQIRAAVGAAPLTERRWLYPLLDLSFRALPHAYRDTEARDGAAVVVRVADDAWSLVREGSAWRLYRGAAPAPAVVATLDSDAAWRLLYNALSEDEARARIQIEGDATLAAPLFAMRSVMV
ncbi:MAG TPA: maleylpyruvate isomerase N-terminal domain-containing protein [Longimicrobium sp.]|nr:maleylpyruvate isomerase N-terminal domain-containing protein [Longimicrobium sp.]